MITNAGLDAIGRTISESLNAYVAVGVGATAVTANDSQLAFEVYRAPIRVRSYDATTGRITFAATIPDSLEISIAEVGLVTGDTADSTGGVVTMFDDSLEEWSAGTWVTANSRLGGGLQVALETATMDASNRSALNSVKQSDKLQIAYFGAGGTVTVRLANSAEDYFSYTFTPQAGYNVHTTPVSSLVPTGAPNLTSANIISVIHAGAGSVMMDAIKISAPSDEEIMIDRQLVSPMKNKIAGMPFDVEFPLAVTL